VSRKQIARMQGVEKDKTEFAIKRAGEGDDRLIYFSVPSKSRVGDLLRTVCQDFGVLVGDYTLNKPNSKVHLIFPRDFGSQ